MSRNRVAPLPGPGEDDLHGTNYAQPSTRAP
jgi:hypothetical protein